MPHNIEKSAFRKGEYVGYGRTGMWLITKDSRGWRMRRRDGAGYMQADTLRQAGLLLDKMG